MIAGPVVSDCSAGSVGSSLLNGDRRGRCAGEFSNRTSGSEPGVTQGVALVVLGCGGAALREAGATFSPLDVEL